MSNDWPLGAVELKVFDLGREVAFYELFGLERISDGNDQAVLGADGAAILKLTSLPDARERPRHTAGLYHFAILLPDERELGGFLQRALEERLPLTGTADHYVSQALYFDDPEGNGIEVYADRPRTEWQYPNGRLNIGTDHLDFDRLLRIADKPKAKFSAETVLGHVHLNVGDLDASQAFYESIGMELTAEAGRVMRFLSWNGYHHHLGINILEGEGAAPIQPQVRGLRPFQVRRIDAPLIDPNGVTVSPML